MPIAIYRGLQLFDEKMTVGWEISPGFQRTLRGTGIRQALLVRRPAICRQLYGKQPLIGELKKDSFVIEKIIAESSTVSPENGCSATLASDRYLPSRSDLVPRVVR